MEHGVVVESGSSRAFFEHPREERTRSFLHTVLGGEAAAERPRWKEASCFG